MLMRDRETKVVREVSEKWHARWPADHEPLEVPKNRPSKKSTIATEESEDIPDSTVE